MHLTIELIIGIILPIFLFDNKLKAESVETIEERFCSELII